MEVLVKNIPMSKIFKFPLDNLKANKDSKKKQEKLIPSANPNDLETFDQDLWLKQNYSKNTSVLHADIQKRDLRQYNSVPEEPPGTIYLPKPFVSTCAAHVHVNGSSVSYSIPGRTQWISFIGHITMRIPPQFASGNINMPVRIATQMWVAENGVIFRLIPGPVYTTSVPTYWSLNMMAKAEFSKPLSFTRPVNNLSVGVDIVSVTNVDDENIGYMNEDGLPIGDLILDVFWRNTDCEEENDKECVPFVF